MKSILENCIKSRWVAVMKPVLFFFGNTFILFQFNDNPKEKKNSSAASNILVITKKKCVEMKKKEWPHELALDFQQLNGNPSPACSHDG